MPDSNSTRPSYADHMTPAQQERFWSNVDKSGAGGCWLWTGGLAHGYGCTNVSGRGGARAHRVSWELLRGPIPEGKHLDHLCRVKNCVNPEHLEPVTNRENVLRGIGRTAMQAKQTECIHGHPFTPENTFYGRTCYGTTYRKCRTCMNKYQRRYKSGRLQREKATRAKLAEALARAESAERERDQFKADAEWRHRWHERLGRGYVEPEGKFYERLEATLARHQGAK